MAYTIDKCTGGTATAGSNVGTYTPDKAFDDVEVGDNFKWYANTALPNWIKYDFGAGVAWEISKIRLLSQIDYGIKDFTVSGSSDNIDYTQEYSGTAINSGTWQEFTFWNVNSYRYVKIDISSSYQADQAQIVIFEMEMMAKVAKATGNFFIFLSQAYDKGKEYFKNKLWLPNNEILVPEGI